MGNFLGYLLKCNNNTDNSWLLASSYKSTPNQREEIKAIRDENTRDLTRVTAEGTKTVIQFQTLPVDLAGKKKIQKFFNDAMTDKLQRKVTVTYWNDQDNDYKTSSFYLPDIEFNIDYIDETNIYYSPLTFKLIEY